jgi:hypothetical protein
MGYSAGASFAEWCWVVLVNINVQAGFIINACTSCCPVHVLSLVHKCAQRAVKCDRRN